MSACSQLAIWDARVGPSPPGRRTDTPPVRRLQLIAAPPFTAIDPLLGVDRRQGQNRVSQGGTRDNRGYSVTAQSETQGVPGPEGAWTVPPGRVRGDAWSVRQYLRDGAAPAEQLAEAYGLRPEFIAAVAGTR